jgi:ATP-binding protein involved in chromosome partitioning
MASKLGMRIVGTVENMSWLVGTGQEIFGSGGGQALADEVGAPLLGRIPLDPALREAADAGTPVLEAAPDSEAAAAIEALADALRGTRRGGIKKSLTVLS